MLLLLQVQTIHSLNGIVSFDFDEGLTQIQVKDLPYFWIGCLAIDEVFNGQVEFFNSDLVCLSSEGSLDVFSVVDVQEMADIRFGWELKQSNNMMLVLYFAAFDVTRDHHLIEVLNVLLLDYPCRSQIHVLAIIPHIAV